MLLKFALLVSSRHEAELIMRWAPHSVIAVARPCYRFSIEQKADGTDQTVYRFAVQRVMHPAAQDDDGQGKVRYSEKYSEQSFLSLESLRSHLSDYGLNTDQWEPVESEQ